MSISNVRRFGVGGADFTRTAVAMDLQNHEPKAGLARRDSLNFALLLLLGKESQLSQREIAARLGVSVGRINYSLKGLLKQGAIQYFAMRIARNRGRYAYQLTPHGQSEKSALAARVMQKMRKDHARLTAQIDALEEEMRSGCPA